MPKLGEPPVWAAGGQRGPAVCGGVFFLAAASCRGAWGSFSLALVDPARGPRARTRVGLGPQGGRWSREAREWRR